jgi:hypothetical protein
LEEIVSEKVEISVDKFYERNQAAHLRKSR